MKFHQQWYFESYAHLFLHFHLHCTISLSSLQCISLHNSTRGDFKLHRKKDALVFRSKEMSLFTSASGKNTAVACSFSNINTAIFPLKRNSLHVKCSKGDFFKGKVTFSQKAKQPAHSCSVSTSKCHELIRWGRGCCTFKTEHHSSLIFKMLASWNIFLQM